MRKSIFFVSVFIVLGLLVSFNALAQDGDIIVDEDITAEDLGVSDQKTLPDSPFYFFKNLWRGVRTALTFNPVKKAELQLRFANEKLIEAKKLAEKIDKEEIAGKAVEKYQKAMEKIKTRVEKFEEKAKDNPKIEAFLDKFTEKAIKQQVLIEKLEENLSHNPEALEKIKEAKERVLENQSRVIQQLEEKTQIRERLEKNIQEMIQKNIPVNLEQKLEQNREKIRERIEKIEEKGACITLWEPVCGKDGKTYSNECFAKRAGVGIDYKGECKTKCETPAACERGYKITDTGKRDNQGCPIMKCVPGKK